MPWYSTIALFKHTRDDCDFQPQFEERISIVKAADAELAEKLLLTEISDYESENTEFLDEYEIKELYEDPGDNPVEVFSVSRVTGLPNDEYIERFWYGSKPESCYNKGWNHVWYNKNGSVEGCYNCREERQKTEF